MQQWDNAHARSASTGPCASDHSLVNIMTTCVMCRALPPLQFLRSRCGAYSAVLTHARACTSAVSAVVSRDPLARPQSFNTVSVNLAVLTMLVPPQSLHKSVCCSCGGHAGPGPAVLALAPDAAMLAHARPPTTLALILPLALRNGGSVQLRELHGFNRKTSSTVT